MDLSRQASLRVGAAPARSRQPVAALLTEDNRLRSACPASTEPLVACAGLSYACSPGLPHSQDSPPLRSTSGYPTPRYDSSSHPGSVGTGDVRDDRVACRLYPVDHVADELVLRLRKTVKHFHHKIVELRSRFPRDCAIIHRAVLSFGWLCNRVLYSVRRRNGQRFCIRSHQAFQAGGGGSPASDETEQGIRRAKRAAEGSGYSGAPATRRLIAREIEKEEVGRSIGDRKLNA